MPPKYKQGPGRPKKLRRREPDEDPNLGKYKRRRTSNKCKRCGKLGHNIRRCPSRPADPQPEASTANVDDDVAPNIATDSTPNTANAAPNIDTKSAPNTANAAAPNIAYDSAPNTATNMVICSGLQFVLVYNLF